MQKRIDETIDKGIEYLLNLQPADTGTWPGKPGEKPGGPKHEGDPPPPPEIYFKVSYASVPGLTLLHCGDKSNPRIKPAVQKAAEFVRANENSDELYVTYNLATAILFLDRLREAGYGDPDDAKLIRTFASRLIASQKRTGGWGYFCEPKLTPDEINALVTHGRRLTPKPSELMKSMQLDPTDASLYRGAPMQGTDKPPSKKDPGTGSERYQRPPYMLLSEKIMEYQKPVDPNQDPKESTDKVPDKIRKLPVFQPPDNPDKLKRTTPDDYTDNSNTQFAILALLAANKDVYPDMPPMDRTFALMVMRYATSQNKDGSWHYKYKNGGHDKEERGHEAMTGVGLLGLAVAYGMATDMWTQATGATAKQVLKDKMDDEMIKNGLRALSTHIVKPDEKDEVMRNLYYLWTVERVAVLYQQKDIAGKDWYPWGAELLMANQKPEGNWTNGRYWQHRDMVDTCLALLFLKRVDLAQNLGHKLPSFQLDEPPKGKP